MCEKKTTECVRETRENTSIKLNANKQTKAKRCSLIFIYLIIKFCCRYS